ncbi:MULTISPECIES: hypothetical protein [unclassified Bradyrhizobium]|uniref:hypothetical protein n=1 Tax=unclassified Bradyrhizobium TaxID=2631580 RepID=UPI00211EEF63|nr:MULTISPECIES: hypothetical protein [unclassified Bradyrhizobium]MDD1536087.1 hypothetical protein [Bradyrhizobium sp. WBOS8]MDD1585657.1 hypothetical protein [Bradyrhizobium sp. WBOS4]UUO49049.1 hypothetical protein DCM78_20310 [Bradyrhizobium sp. WBOS04]UUO62864.1 hypothetical protein DCM80_29185 [Bradyrhizobium sp. WBOS08]
MTKDSILYDKNGKRVHRLNGVMADGDRLVVGMRLMDAAPASLSVVSLRDTEGDAPPTQEQLDAAYQARCSRMEDAWRHPNQQETTGKQIPLASVDDAIEQRNRRLENAWKG